MQEDYNVNIDDVVTKRPFLFCDFLGGGDREDREYVYVEDHAKVSVFSLVVLTACFLRLLCLRSLFSELPSPSAPAETLSGLSQVKPENVSFFPELEPCFPSRVVFLSVSGLCLLPVFCFLFYFK